MRVRRLGIRDQQTNAERISEIPYHSYHSAGVIALGYLVYLTFSALFFSHITLSWTVRWCLSVTMRPSAVFRLLSAIFIARCLDGQVHEV